MEDLSVLEEVLRALEERLLQPDARQSAPELDALLADDFIEFGSSGRVYNKQQAIAALQPKAPTSVLLTDFRLKVLASNVVLVTYQALRSSSPEIATLRSLRSSLWRLLDERWQIVFHQATSLPPE